MPQIPILLSKNRILEFREFGFDPAILEGLDAMGFEQATPIQEQAIPQILQGNDLIACAQTGTGKTGAYLLPVMNLLLQRKQRHNSVLILAPTRELAQQIDLQIEGLSYFTNLSSLAVYGGGDGVAYIQQKQSMKDGVDFIIATPGRLISHLASGALKMNHLEFLILDEADRMLDMGFYDDIMKIVGYLPQKRQTLLFSATMPPKIRNLAQRILHNPQQVNIAISKPAAGILQQVYKVFDTQKVPLLSQLVKSDTYKRIIVFAGRKETVRDLGRSFRRAGLKAAAFHSDLDQKEREEIMLNFKNDKLDVLIGTDVLSRGIDVEGIDLVVNFDVPQDPEDYVHRIGRTARAASTGTAITFVNAKDKRRLANIEKLIERQIEVIPLPEFLGEGPKDEAEFQSKPKKKKKAFRSKRKPQSKPKHPSATVQAN